MRCVRVVLLVGGEFGPGVQLLQKQKQQAKFEQYQV